MLMGVTLTPELTPGSRVSTLELFFDLVFVFTVTQVTQVVAHAHGPAGYAQAALILGLLWWMYGGYAWLTNNVGTDSPLHRLLLLCGMFGFLVAALAIPSAFGAGGVAFGLAYLLVNLIHAQNSSALAILRIAPFNLGGALLVTLAGVLGGDLRVPLWLLAFLLPVASTLFRRYGAFSLSPQHFVERHGLVLIIALGESVVSIGVGAADLPISARLVLTAGLALALVAALWWSYFGGNGIGGEEQRAEHALSRANGADRARMALFAFGYAYLMLLAGVVLASAGIKGMVAHLEGHASPQVAWTLSCGVALFLIGESLFRLTLGTGRGRSRLLIGLIAGGLWQLLVLLTMLLAEGRASTGVTPTS